MCDDRALSKLDDFETWLRATGTPEDVALFSSSIVTGLLALAGKQAVTAAHVATGVQFARDAGLVDVVAMERIGALLVEFESAPAVTAAPPEPLAISIRMPKVSASIPVVDTPVPPVSPRRRRPLVPIAVVVVAVGGVGAWWLTRGDGEPAQVEAKVAAPSAPSASATIDRLVPLDLPVAFPSGWQLVPSTAAAKTARVVYGAPTDPDDQVFVATLRLEGALAGGLALETPALIAVAHDAEAGAAARLLAGEARYYSEGCEAAGAQTAVCRGTATRDGEVVTLQTFVRVGAKRAVLALFMAKPGVPEPRRIATEIVNGFEL